MTGSASLRLASAVAVVSLLAATPSAIAATLVGDAAATCSGLAGASDGAMRIDSAAIQQPSPLSVADKAGSPAARVVPANPAFCKVLGHIAPKDAQAPPIKFEVNLPTDWNGRSLQYAVAASTAC